MGLLVEDLLLARLDQQRPLERRPVDLLALAADAVNDARAVAPDRRIQLLTGGDSGAAGPLVVLGDEARLRQVIANLMSNALTHTPAGTPVELAAWVQRLDGAPRAVLEVRDLPDTAPAIGIGLGWCHGVTAGHRARRGPR
jgi:two-component system, OmpR family, sensor kinase